MLRGENVTVHCPHTHAGEVSSSPIARSPALAAQLPYDEPFLFTVFIAKSTLDDSAVAQRTEYTLLSAVCFCLFFLAKLTPAEHFKVL